MTKRVDIPLRSLAGVPRRTDVGDLRPLMESIRGFGLLRPLCVLPSGLLISGERRVAAALKLGYETLPGVQAMTIHDVVKHLRGDREEATLAMDMPFTVMCQIWQEVIAFDTTAREVRRRQSFVAGGRKASLVKKGLAEKTTERGTARSFYAEQFSEAFGISGTTYSRLWNVWKHAQTDEEPAVRQAARVALANMDAIGMIAGEYDKFRRVVDAPLVAARRPATKRAVDQSKIIDNLAHTLAGVRLAIDNLGPIDEALQAGDQAAQWVRDLAKTRRSLETLMRALKEPT